MFCLDFFGCFVAQFSIIFFLQSVIFFEFCCSYQNSQQTNIGAVIMTTLWLGGGTWNWVCGDSINWCDLTENNIVMWFLVLSRASFLTIKFPDKWDLDDYLLYMFSDCVLFFNKYAFALTFFSFFFSPWLYLGGFRGPIRESFGPPSSCKANCTVYEFLTGWARWRLGESDEEQTRLSCDARTALRHTQKLQTEGRQCLGEIQC